MFCDTSNASIVTMTVHIVRMSLRDETAEVHSYIYNIFSGCREAVFFMTQVVLK